MAARSANCGNTLTVFAILLVVAVKSRVKLRVKHSALHTACLLRSQAERDVWRRVGGALLFAKVVEWRTRTARKRCRSACGTTLDVATAGLLLRVHQCEKVLVAVCDAFGKVASIEKKIAM
jgi:hypothetical protein